MIEIKECMQFWRTYLNTHEKNLNDHQYQIIVSTMNHLSDYFKLKENVSAKLPLKPGDDTG